MPWSHRWNVGVLTTLMLLSLVSCGESSTSRPVTPDRPTNPSPAATPSPVGLLSPAQQAELRQLKIPIVFPQVLPANFRLVKLITGKEPYLSGDVYWYSAFYQGPENACLEIAANSDPAMSLRRLQQDTMQTPVGMATIYAGDVDGKPLRLGLLTLPPKNGYMVRSGGWVPGTNPGRRCQPVTEEAFKQVLRSLQRLPAP